MASDEAWDMPQIRWVQQGSFEPGSIPPAVDPRAGTQVWLGPIAREWLPWICGSLDQGRNPSSWIVPDDATMSQTLRRWDDLMGLICGNGGSQNPIMLRLQNCVLQSSSDGGTTWVDVPGWSSGFADCVKTSLPAPVPILPPGNPVNQQACNIAGFVASEILKNAVNQVVVGINNSYKLVTIGSNISETYLQEAFPYTNLFVQAVFDLYTYISAGTIAHFSSAVADPTLWSALTCAIYNAIKNDGFITPGNYPTVKANICAVSYTYSDVITAICTYITDLGLSNLEALQSAGALESVDCSACGISCYQWNFSAGAGPWIIGPGVCSFGHYDAAVHYFVGDLSGGGCLPGYEVLFLVINFAHPQHIKGVKWEIAQGDVNDGTARIQGLLSGSLVFNFTAPNGPAPAWTVQSEPADGIVDTVHLFLTCRAGSSLACRSIGLDFAGVNPFGPENCTY